MTQSPLPPVLPADGPLHDDPPEHLPSNSTVLQRTLPLGSQLAVFQSETLAQVCY